MARVGIAGYGFMGRFHHAAYAKTKAGDVVAVFDVNPEAFAAEATEGNIGVAQADLTGVRQFSEYDALLKEVDVVDICTPTPFHLEMVMQAFAAGKHVLLEKPMALSLKECEEMLAAAASAGTTFMVAHCVRFWPGYDVLLEAAGDGRWGPLRSVTFTRIGGCAFWSPWFMSEEKSGGAVLDLMVHDFDICRVLGGMPEAVDATGSVDGLGPGSGVNYADVVIRPSVKDAPALSVLGGWLPSESFPFAMRYLAQFQDATLRFASDAEHPLILYTKTADPEPIELSPGDGYEAEVSYFLSVLGSRPDRCPPEESRDTVAIALAAKESVLTGKPVTLL